MKSSVQLGLFCLSLLISSLHGEEVVETDTSMQMPFFFDEPDLHQFEMYRVRRQTVTTEKENPEKTLAIVPPRENSRTRTRKQPHPGGFSLLGKNEKPETYVKHRTKRQEKSRNNKRKKRPGSLSVLASIGVLLPKETAKVKRDAK